MKIYFSASMSGAPREHKERYKKIVDNLKELGHRVIAEHLFGRHADVFMDRDSEISDEARALHQKMLAWKNQADLVIVEASYPSISIGQEVSYAINHNKPTIVLYIQDRQPHVLRSIGEEYLHIVEYNDSNLRKTLKDYIEYARETADTRFNFFVSSEIDSFLDWISKQKKVPRAVFLRQLIEDDMKKNREYLRDTGREEKK